MDFLEFILSSYSAYEKSELRHIYVILTSSFNEFASNFYKSNWVLIFMTCSIFRMFEILGCFPCPISLLASFILDCVFIVKAVIINFLEDEDVGILYLSTKFEL